MKNNVMWCGLICGWSLAAFFGWQSLDARWELQRTTLVQQLSDKRNELLQDQVADLESHMRTTRTYDEGYVAAMTRSNTSEEYVNGYHAAMEQLAAKDGLGVKTVSFKPAKE